jgi:curved DNA-binding protein CbpA
VRNRDPLGYYAALNISPDATAAEIHISYKFIRQSCRVERRHLDIGKIRAAYETLSNPTTRQDYDNTKTAGFGALAWNRSITPRKVLVPVLVVSAVLLLIIVAPGLRTQFRSFEPGDELYWTENSEALGKVLSFDRDHRFPSGAVVPAFEVLPASGEAPVWYPARDLKRYARAH